MKLKTFKEMQYNIPIHNIRLWLSVSTQCTQKSASEVTDTLTAGTPHSSHTGGELFLSMLHGLAAAGNLLHLMKQQTTVSLFLH
jgi:hypothetical protein